MAAEALTDVVAAVIVRDGLVLTCRRRPERSAGGLWEFPGGKVEPGETLGSALERELLEELNIVAVAGEVIVVNEVADAGIRLICLHAAISGEDPAESTDHDAIEWVPRGELKNRRWAPADLPAVFIIAG